MAEAKFIVYVYLYLIKPTIAIRLPAFAFSFVVH